MRAETFTGRESPEIVAVPRNAEAMIEVAMIRLMAGRLADGEVEPRGPIETEAARRLADDLKSE
ncbi:hypothetical protein ACWD4P_32035 [Kitasatospora sp. NPDC002543]